MREQALENLPPISWTIIAIVITLTFFNFGQTYLRLRHIPGPGAAALTNLVRRSWVFSGDLHERHVQLHQQYGTVVRVGPLAVLVSDPDAIDKIYGFKTKFLKACVDLSSIVCFVFSMSLT